MSVNEESFYTCDAIFLSSQKFERLVGPLSDRFCAQIQRHIATS